MEKNDNLLSVICRIFYIPTSDVFAVKDSTLQNHKVVTVKSGKGWKQLYFAPGSASLEIKEEQQDAGRIHEHKMKLTIPGEDVQNSADLESFADRPLLWRLDYSGGKSKLLGEISNPARILRQSQASEKITGHQLVATWMSQYTARWLIVGEVFPD